MTERLFKVVYHERTSIPNPDGGRAIGYIITEAAVSSHTTNTGARDNAHDVAYVFQTALRYVGNDSTADVRERDFLSLPNIDNIEAQAQRAAIGRHDRLVSAMALKWSDKS